MIQWAVMLFLQAGCSWAKLESWAWKRKVEVQQRSLRNLERNENGTVRNNILSFSLMIHISERLLDFDFFMIFNDIEDNFAFACNSLLNFPFSSTSTTPSFLTIQNVYHLDCVCPSFLKYRPWTALKLSIHFTWGHLGKVTSLIKEL